MEDKVEIHIAEAGMVGSTLRPNQQTDLNMILYDPNKDSRHLSHNLVKFKKIYRSATKFNEEIRSKESGLCLVGGRFLGEGLAGSSFSSSSDAGWLGRQCRYKQRGWTGWRTNGNLQSAGFGCLCRVPPGRHVREP